MNSKVLIASTAARIVGSEMGSTVKKNDTRFLGHMGLPLQRIDIDIVAGNDLGYSSYNTSLIVHGEAQIPADRSGILADFEVVRIQES